MSRYAPGPDREGYEWLLDEVAHIAADHEHENELGAAALATHAVLAPLPAEEAAKERLHRWTRLFGSDQPSTFRRTQADIADATRFGRDLVLHEGYRVDPHREGARAIEALREVWGDRLVASSPQAWLTWGRKHAFRHRARMLLGEAAIPPGTDFTLESSTDWNRSEERIGVATVKRVVKFDGTGGTGNIIVPAGQTLRSVAHIAESLLESTQDRPVVGVVEMWLPWLTSLSISFLLRSGREPELLAATEQLVDTRHARFVGSSSSTPLHRVDLDAACTYVNALAEAMADDGVVGVTAVDVIVGAGWSEHGLELPSGLRMCAIECNPRMNRHNRVGLLVHRLARHWGVPPSQLSWVLRDTPTVQSIPTFELERLPLANGRTPRFQLADQRRTMTLILSRNGERS